MGMPIMMNIKIKLGGGGGGGGELLISGSFFGFSVGLPLNYLKD